MGARAALGPPALGAIYGMYGMQVELLGGDMNYRCGCSLQLVIRALSSKFMFYSWSSVRPDIQPASCMHLNNSCYHRLGAPGVNSTEPWHPAYVLTARTTRIRGRNVNISGQHQWVVSWYLQYNKNYHWHASLARNQLASPDGNTSLPDWRKDMICLWVVHVGAGEEAAEVLARVEDHTCGRMSRWDDGIEMPPFELLASPRKW